MLLIANPIAVPRVTMHVILDVYNRAVDSVPGHAVQVEKEVHHHHVVVVSLIARKYVMSHVVLLVTPNVCNRVLLVAR